VADDQPGDNDPGVLPRDLAAALDRIEPAGPGMVEAPEVPGAAVVDAVLPQLGSALASTALPAVLVLDDLHLLENRDCLDAVTRLIDYLPAGSRGGPGRPPPPGAPPPPLPLARLRAELRLLRLLATHFSFREIGDQLKLSQHTVKSQAMSIYRKFGMSSRSEAIRHAHDLGLLVE
jgi:ATP/maltotriose-dependent transcriptional regulator MalT